MVHPASKASADLAGGPEAPASPSSAQHPADLAALTGRDDFLLELGELLSGRASVHPADSIEAAVEPLSQARGGQVLAIDTRDTGDVRVNVARASEQAPEAVILVFTEAHSEKEVAAALKGTKVFAVLTLPLEPAKTAAVLEAALDQANHGTAAKHSLTHKATYDRPREGAEAAPQPDPDEPPRRGMLWAATGAAVLAIAAGAGWYLLRGKAPAPAAARGRISGAHTGARHATSLSQPVVDTSIVRGRIDVLLDRASRAMFERHFTTPKGANALVYFRSVLAVDPTNGEALNGLQRVGNVLTSRFNDEMSRAQYPQAALALATLKVAQPTDPRIASFERKLYAAEISSALAGKHPGQAAALLAQAAPAGVPAAQLRSWRSQVAQMQQHEQTKSLAAAITADIGSDDFNGPSGALAQLAQLRTVAPAAPGTQTAARTLITALLAKAREDARAGKTSEESSWLNDARSVGASAGEINSFEHRLAAERVDEVTRAKANRLLARVRARLGGGALIRPPNDSAAYYLTALGQTHPTGDILEAEQQARGELSSKLLARAESEARAGNGDAAHADVAQARRWGASETAVRAATGTIATSLRRAFEPTPADLQRLAAQLVRTRYVAPSYPNEALAQRIAGQVIVQYVVDRKGVPQHVRVISAKPAGVFNRATLDAVRAWRYRAVKFHGHPVEIPVRTLIRFVLPN